MTDTRDELLDAMAAALSDARSVLLNGPHTKPAVECPACNAFLAVRNALASYRAYRKEQDR